MHPIWSYIQSDYYRYSEKVLSPIQLIFKAIFSNNHCFRFLFWLRLASPLSYRWIRLFAKVMHHHYMMKYNLHISASTKIGYGLYIGHGVGIVINAGTKIGNNVNISQFLSIGTNHDTPAVIGDNVYIGPNVSIVEDVIIGNNSIVGAGSVVVHDVPENSTVVGCPAKKIGENNHPEYIARPWILK